MLHVLVLVHKIMYMYLVVSLTNTLNCNDLLHRLPWYTLHKEYSIPFSGTLEHQRGHFGPATLGLNVLFARLLPLVT